MLARSLASLGFSASAFALLGWIGGLAACSDSPTLFPDGSPTGAGGTGGAGGEGMTTSSGGGGGAPDAAPDYDLLYDDASINSFTITFEASQWAALEQNKQQNKMLPPDQRDFIYVPCSVTFNGETWKDVGFRYKGNSSFGIPGLKHSFKLDFDEFIDEQRIFGLKKMNFNNGFKDPSMLRECLSLEMYRSAGVTAPRCTYARIHYDLGDGAGPRYWGLFTSVEQVDKTFLIDRFTAENAEGNLYKPDGPGDNLSVFNQATFEKKTNETAADYSDIIHLIDTIAASNDANAVKANLAPILSLDGILRFMAINTILTSWDSYAGTGHNYYLYNNPKNKASTGKDTWEYIVWDANEAFGNFIPMGSAPSEMLTWPWDQPSTMSPKPLFTKIMMVPEWRAQIAQYMKDFIADPAVFEKTSMQNRAQALHDLISGAVHEDKNYLFPTASPDLFTQNLTQDLSGGPMGGALGIKPYIQARADFLAGSLP